ncbi:phage portal protein [Paenarthrobacter sp. OM7]|uniref:phage portal protein n=1 Tax=Paenarthrobacter sp. OM7 TaxID=3041264 RepID=UPI0024685B65|nr:phage portal protein [Paenarthrobacter sp. OM7]WGM21854.1 phage portal protein [Paenarthrobacter sp. OM7]
MEQDVARRWLEKGVHELSKQKPEWERRQNYLEGEQDLPFAPEGVNFEYLALQKMSLANVLELAMKAPIQRLQADGFRTGREGKADLTAWNEIWQPNMLDSRQVIVYQEMFVHGRGIMSVTPNLKNPKSPKIRPENAKRVWIEPDPEDPFSPLFAVKVLKVQAPAPSGLILPASFQPVGTEEVAYVYDHNTWMKFARAGGGMWNYRDAGDHNLDDIPFVNFDFNVDSDGKPRPAITKLMPQQDSINTIRFNTLLAMQFSAYRQRVFTGFDPVVRDRNGAPMVKVDSNGTPILDANGLQQPVLNSPGRIGVDRALIFPGVDTKVFDLPESNLDNYIKVLQQFLGDFFANAQIPPQYAMDKLANLSGDGMAGAESTFQSLVKDVQTAAGEGVEKVMRLANRARGESYEDVASEVIWADTEIRSFAQIVDGIQKLIASGMSRKDAWATLPGATPPKVDAWVTNSDKEREQADQAVREIADKVAFNA